MTTCQSEMKIPIRPAPPPPVNQIFPPKSVSNWDRPAIKKKPPPRPPPPKFTNQKTVPSRPSQLIAGLFQRKSNPSKPKITQISKTAGDTNNDSKSNNGLLLIDFSSPPSSPTFTTRSNSDALSVNSFGSDGINQGSGSSGNTSNVESGFEDDFDLFANRKCESAQIRDPWSPPPKPPEPKITGFGKSWVTFPSPDSSKKIPSIVSSMPTIIRSKPDGHKIQPKTNNCDTRLGTNVNSLADVLRDAHINDSKQIGFSNCILEEEDDDGWSSESPPMPTCPPPPPPEIPDNQNITEEPYAIALYDYTAEQPDDLSFKKDDVIVLVRKIDENWVLGKKDGFQGSVPTNFISVCKPLHGNTCDTLVTAIYAFRSEAWDDLEFEEGSVIKVASRIDQDWLYGECNGKFGQFPASFVDRVPECLPMRGTTF